MPIPASIARFIVGMSYFHSTPSVENTVSINFQQIGKVNIITKYGTVTLLIFYFKTVMQILFIKRFVGYIN
jgi:hypothetical protein